MPVINLIPLRNAETCSISETGSINFPQLVAERLGWSVPSKIAVSYLDDPLALLFSQAERDQEGYTLSHQTRPPTPRTGTKIRCSIFAARILGPRIELPLRGLVPTFLPSGKFPLALVIQPPAWTQEDFSQAGVKAIPAELKGVYQLVNASGVVVRIGEGTIADRIREHLKDERLTSTVRSVQYFRLADKEETQLWERILLAQYERRNGQLPPFNRIRG